MLALGIDFVAAYLLTRKLRNIWALVALAIVAGALSTIVANSLMYLIAGSTFTAGEIVVRIAGGIIWHPLITIIAVLVFRKRQAREESTPIIENTANNVEPPAEADEISEYVQFLSSSPSDAEATERTRALIASGYDTESLIDIVRERAGINEVELVERAVGTNA